MTKIVAISAFGVLLSACNANQMQTEGSSAAVVSKGAPHIHNVEGYGDFTHQHAGNSTAAHSHSWKEMQDYITNQ